MFCAYCEKFRRSRGAFGQCQLTSGTDLLWAKVTNSQTGWSFCRCENYDSSLNPFGDDDEDGDIGGGGGDTIVAGRNNARPARPRRKPRLDCKPKYLQMRHCLPVVHWLLPPADWCCPLSPADWCCPLSPADCFLSLWFY